MTQQGRKSTLTASGREHRLEGTFIDVPELAFTPLGDPDPRLVRLARLLGEQLARENFIAQMNRREPRRSR
ncbi:hypothetical protein ACLBWS_18465 [Brucellaceae bacterium D45D]